jgi:hypothetical protein
MSKNVFFYRKNCKSSQLLISLMEKERMIKYFYLYCLDDHLPNNNTIKKTPTIIVADFETPFVEEEAFAWFERTQLWKHEETIKKINSDRKQFINKNLGITDDDSNIIIGFNPAEMSSITDGFSFVEDKLVDETLPQAYYNVTNFSNDEIIPVFADDITNKNKNRNIDEEHEYIVNDESKKIIDKIKRERQNQELTIMEQNKMFASNYKNTTSNTNKSKNKSKHRSITTTKTTEKRI